VFPGSPSRGCWSSSSLVLISGGAWYVGFGSGAVSTDLTASIYNVRCVRGGAAGLGSSAGVSGGGGRYTVTEPKTGEKIVTDAITGLIWQYNNAPTKQIWKDALSYCATVDYGTYKDWRLPNKNELMSIVNYARENSPASDFPGLSSEWYWSSSSIANGSFFVWIVNFGDGVVSDVGKDDKTGNVRCLRGGP
jgi:hypothetical protein